MAQFNFAEKSEIEELHIEPTDVMTGDKNKSRYLLYQLKLSMARAKQIDIIVSFLMESGVRMLLSDLKAALQRGVRIRILTGNYLGITQPSALYLLKKELGDKVELHFYSDKGRSFHPKSYIFHYDNMNEIYIGSSNISRSALTSGIEWNYRFNNNQDSQNFNLFYETFEDLFKNHSYVINDAELKEYSKNWHKPAVAKDLARYDQVDPDTKVEMLFQPRGAQIEALCALENSRAEGAVRGLVHAATGVGKTYLAAFDSAKYERVLFVAHREEILKQAAVSFKNVRHSDDYGFFDGKQKDTGKSVIFASVATLGRSEYLTEEYFAPDYFTYLVIDEFHHAVTDQYQRIVNYFKPQFMLGLTATPERMDGKSIYEICDYNVPYEITLKEAINKGALVPFHYYSEIEYPDDCIVDFDMRLIDLFREMDKKSLSIQERIKQEYYRVKELLDGKVPTRMELFTNMDDNIYEYCMKHSKENPFKRYMDFLYEIHELSDEELQVYNGIGKEFLQLIETTDMQKVYKMPILYGFYNDGNVRMAVTEDEVIESWKRFFNRGTNWKDFPQVTSYEEYRRITDKQHLSKAKSMPIKFLKASGKGFFIDKDGYALGIRDELADVIKADAFKKQMKDIIEYRTMEYYRRRYVEK